MNDEEIFLDHVRDAFAHLYDPPYLNGHPLVDILANGGRRLSGDGLRRALLEAIEELKPPLDAPSHSTSWRRYRYLYLRYREGASHEAIARELLISTRQARRDHLDALKSVSAALWKAFSDSKLGVEPSLTPTDQRRTLPHERREVEPALDTELSKSEFRAAGQHCDLGDILMSVGGIANTLAQRQGIRIDVSVPPSLPAVAIDRTILRQILLSLLSYAIEIPFSRHLAFTAVADAAVAQLRIQGDPVTQLSSVSEIRSEQSEESEALLATARHLAELHGVDLTLSQTTTGLLAITVTVPVARQESVLVVDDNPDVPKLIERYLRGTTYNLLCAKTWRRALELAKDAQPDIILLDVMMPSQDGWDILQQLKAHPLTRETPVVICSVVPEKSLAFAMGASAFLAKPVTQTSLLDVLRQCRHLGSGAHPSSP